MKQNYRNYKKTYFTLSTPSQPQSVVIKVSVQVPSYILQLILHFPTRFPQFFFSHLSRIIEGVFLFGGSMLLDCCNKDGDWGKVDDGFTYGDGLNGAFNI